MGNNQQNHFEQNETSSLRFHKLFIYIIIPIIIINFISIEINAFNMSLISDGIWGIIGIISFVYLFYVLYNRKTNSMITLKIVLIINIIFVLFHNLNIQIGYKLIFINKNIKWQILLSIFITFTISILINEYYKKRRTFFNNL